MFIFGVKRTHTSFRSWKITHHTWHRPQCLPSTCLAQYLFEEPVNQGTYFTILWDWFVPQLEYLGLLGHVWFQQDGAPAHCIIIVRELLNKVFRDKWIGHGSQHLLAPLVWSSRSPDLSSCDKALQDSSNRRLLKSGTGHLRNLKKLFGMHLFPLLQQCCAGRHIAHGDKKLSRKWRCTYWYAGVTGIQQWYWTLAVNTGNKY
jgi:hypothetical protein